MARIKAATWLCARVLASAGLVALIVFACATLLDGVLRGFFNSPIEAVGDVGPVAVAVCMAACFPLAVLEKSNIRIKLLSTWLSDRARSWLEIGVEAMTFLVLVGIARQMFVYAHNTQEGGDSTVMLEIPVAPFWYAVAVMIGLAALAQAIALVVRGSAADVDHEHTGAHH